MSSPSADTSATRTLRPNPNLEYERKQARKLLNQLRRSDAQAVQRARSQMGARGPSPEGFKLSDAQFVIAREYGFRSWPRLVEYFQALQRQQHAHLFRELSNGGYERRAQMYLKMHQRGDPFAARFLGAYVPRFYGATLEEVLAATVSIDDARLVVAREEHSPNWEALIKQTPPARDNYWEYFDSPRGQAGRALEAHDKAELQRIIEAHPELIQPGPFDMRFDRPLIYHAVSREMESGSPADREMTDWLVSQGADPSAVLNHMLLGHMRMPKERVAFLLERGADPNWLTPNGITVLEHALFRYWNGAAADLIAARVVPRKALWIAAGLGDVRALDRYFDRHGKPNEAALRHRPDFPAMFSHSMLPPLSITDPLEVVWEAFFVAGLNDRFGVLDALLQRGFPIDYMGYGMSLLSFAVGNLNVPLVEFLVTRGADLNLMQRYNGTPRDHAESHFQSNPDSDNARRVLELCGGRKLPREPRGPDSEPARLIPHAERVFDLAREEAHRLGQPEVEPHNVFVAMLRDEAGYLIHTLTRAEVDIGRLRRTLGQRLVKAEGQTIPDLPLSAETATVLQTAKENAESRGGGINRIDVLDALLRLDNGAIRRIVYDDTDETLERVRQALSKSGVGF